MAVNNQRGFALVITLIVCALLVALIVTFIDEVYVDTSQSKNFVAGEQASLLANSGAKGGMMLLKLTLGPQSYSSLLDLWAKPLKLENDLGTLVVTIEDENGKLNLNKVVGDTGEPITPYDQFFLRLLKQQGLSADLYDTLADWIDLNDTPHPGGAESTYYLSLKPPYKAHNARLETVEELALVKGFIQQTKTASGVMDTPLARLRPFVTVYASVSDSEPATQININTAPEEVLAALHEQLASGDLAKRIVEYRKTTPFKAAAELAKVPGLDNIATQLMTRICVKGNVYRIRSQAWVRDISRVTEAVVRLNGSNEPSVLYWREY